MNGPAGQTGIVATFATSIFGMTGPTGPRGPTGPIGATGIANMGNTSRKFPPEEGSRDCGQIELDGWLRVVAEADATMSRDWGGPPKIAPEVRFVLVAGDTRRTLVTAGQDVCFSASPAVGLRLAHQLIDNLTEVYKERGKDESEVARVVSDEDVQKMWFEARHASLRHFVSAAASLVVHEISPEEVVGIWREADVREIMET